MKDITVILDRRDLKVSIETGTLRIDRPDSRKPERIPLNMIESVIVMGDPTISCNVWRSLSEYQISAVLLPLRGKGEAAYMGAGLSGSVEKRMAQAKAIHKPSISIAISRYILSQKLSGQIIVLKEAAGNRPDAEEMCEPIRKCHSGLKNAEDQSVLMGHEGAAAAAYFRTLGKLIPDKWNFSGRNRQPPKDPVNALLSLSYVLAGGEVRKTVQETGLDPAMGFLHSSQPGRDSFVLDILEPLRPEIDRFVLNLLDTTITPRNFSTNSQEGCLLNKAGRKAFYEAWSVWKSDTNLKSKAKEIVSEVVKLF